MIDQPSLLSDLALLSVLLGGSACASICALLTAQVVRLGRGQRGVALEASRRAGRHRMMLDVAFGSLTVALIGVAALAAMGVTPWGPVAGLTGLAAFASFLLASVAPIAVNIETASKATRHAAVIPTEAKAA
jgi:hypothetical protein